MDSVRTGSVRDSEQEWSEVEAVPAPASSSSYTVTVRGHTLLVDQPSDQGGADAGMQPLETFVAGLTACVAHYAGRYLVRHGIDREGLQVFSRFALARDRPARIGWIKISITVPPDLPPARRDALLAVASSCTAHNTLRHRPEVDITLSQAAGDTA